MAVSPGCCATEWELLYNIALNIANGSGGGGGSGTVQTGNKAIGSGVDTISVTFATPFASAPSVIVSLSRPVGESIIDVNVDQASITTTGFTASLGSTTPDANYKINWIAN